MAQEPVDDDATHPPSSTKKRRLSDDTHARIKAAIQHNGTLARIALPTQHHQSPVAFSRDGLVAYQKLAQSSTQIAIALAPLSAAWNVKSHLLHVPLPSHANASYKVAKLEFSTCGSSLVAVIRSGEIQTEQVALPGQVCIWSRDAASNAAINQGWNVTAAWPLSAQSTLGCDIVGLHWVDSASHFIVKQPPQSRDEAANPAAPQLPGTDPNKPADGVFERIAVPSRGPQLTNRSQPAQGLVLVGSNGMVHLAHRNTATQQSYPYPPTLASLYATKPFTLLSAPLCSPSLAGATTSAAFGEGLLSAVAFHPVSESSTLFIAAVSEDAARQITLTEVEITDHPSAIMTTRPLPPIQLDAVQWEGQDVDTDAISHLAFTSTVDTSQAANKEDISLVVGLTSRSSTATLLASYSIRHGTDAKSEFLSDAFNNLQSRKKSVDASAVGSKSGWEASLETPSVVHRRSLAHLSPSALRLDGSKVSSALRAFWLDDGRHSIAIEDLNPHTLQATMSTEANQHTINPPIPLRPWAFSPHAAFVSGAMNGKGPAQIRAAGVPWQAYTDSSQRHQSLAASLFDAICNGTSYDDILLASSGLLLSSKNRRAVLQCYVVGRGLNRPNANETSLPPQWLMQELLTLALKMNTAVLKTKSKLVSVESMAKQMKIVTWLLDLFHRFSAIYSAKTANDEWDVLSLADVLPTADALVRQCEAVAKESLLMHKGVQSSPDSRTVDVLTILATHAGIRRILTMSLQLLLDLVSWLEKVNAAGSPLTTDLVQRNAKQLVQEVALLKSMRKPWAAPVSDGAQPQTWPDASNPVPISGMQMGPDDVDTTAPATSPTPPGIRTLLSSAHETLAERLRTSGIILQRFLHRLASFESGQPSRSAIDALLDLLFDERDTATSKAALARHLVPSVSNAEPSILKRQGLDLLLNPDDYVHTLSDIDLDVSGSTAASTEDAITCTTLQAQNRKRNLITGQWTTYSPTRREPTFGCSSNAAVGIVAGSIDARQVAVNPFAEETLVAECLAKASSVRKRWERDLARARAGWWAV